MARSISPGRSPTISTSRVFITPCRRKLSLMRVSKRGSFGSNTAMNFPHIFRRLSRNNPHLLKQKIDGSDEGGDSIRVVAKRDVHLETRRSAPLVFFSVTH